MVKYFSLAIISFFFVVVSCTKEKATPKSGGAVTPVTTPCDSVSTDFVTQIQPLFLNSCATSGCHSSASNAAGYTFETYSQISSNSSIAFSTIKQINGFSPMPKFSAPLPDSSIQKIDCWISKGKPQ